jgi:uncharacterized protein (TIGR00369 family)
MTTQSASERESVPVAPSVPERLFRVSPPALDDGIVSCSMPTGPWLNGPAGQPLGGALGVLIDDVVGYALVLERPPGRWSVSAEISLDLCQPVPADGSVLTARARNLSTDASGGLSSGSVLDADGALIAVCRQHGRWIPGSPDVSPASLSQPRTGNDLAELLGVRAHPTEAGGRLDLTVPPDLVNPMGNLHGGITLCLCDLLAHTALAHTALGGHRPTASVHVAYLRALPLGSTARFDCTIEHRGRSFAVARISAVNDAGKPCVIATVTTR